jgi:hypothetical protein
VHDGGRSAHSVHRVADVETHNANMEKRGVDSVACHVT